MTPDAEEGSTIPLILVLLALAAGFVILAAGATALHLERMRLLTVADGAALAAAESFPLADAHVEGGAVVPRLDDARVRTVAADFLATADTQGLEGLRLDRASTPDGRSALVTLTGTWRPPLVSPLLPLALPVTVTSTATARFR